MKRSFHGDDLTVRQLGVPNWLENVQPKQERHSMQITGGIQCLVRVVRLSGNAHKVRNREVGSELIKVKRSFRNSFKRYLLLLLGPDISVDKAVKNNKNNGLK
ncbi:hypothetical protein LPB19_03890 [Marinobacter salinisoli]|uniref:Uncharacterized protein n=1 Tax=Marinobacter salinisoli TaxID=2769486 RepID=A0ABX7MTS5_9GAMM|nr:hypothetical protein [Marinobacter salinisoli]QSP95569.1 hypothetical protein LPB19_03890 [Marinobacter salinisoli]